MYVQGNVVASLLKGYNPDLSPLLQQPTFSTPLIPSSHAPIGRKLQQDNVIVSPSLPHLHACQIRV